MHKLLKRDTPPPKKNTLRNPEIQNKINREVCILINLNLGKQSDRGSFIITESLKPKPQVT